MKAQTKDRLMTLGTVLVICSLGVSLPGCAVNHTTAGSAGVSPHHSQPQLSHNSSHIADPLAHQCTTDFDCEMHEREGSQHSEGLLGDVPRWKVWTWVAAGALVSGYLYAQRQSQGGDNRGVDIKTPGVSCVAAGCAQ